MSMSWCEAHPTPNRARRRVAHTINNRSFSTTSSSCRREMTLDTRFRHSECLSDLSGRLVKEAAIDSKQAGERGISAKSVKKVTAVCDPNLPFPTTIVDIGSLGYAIQVQGLKIWQCLQFLVCHVSRLWFVVSTHIWRHTRSSSRTRYVRHGRWPRKKTPRKCLPDNCH